MVFIARDDYEAHIESLLGENGSEELAKRVGEVIVTRLGMHWSDISSGMISDIDDAVFFAMQDERQE